VVRELRSARRGVRESLPFMCCESRASVLSMSSSYAQPTAQERDQSIGGKWKRTGVWFFRFEIKSLVPDERSNKIITLATKDAADHTFAVKTANWGWQQFAKRDGLFLHPTVQMADGFLILCTIQAQPQPPAGYWLGMGIPPSIPQPAMMNVGGRNVGSGGGLSAWSGGSGASGGVAGGVAAGGGIKRVVPKDLVSAVGSMLDDPRGCSPLLWSGR